MKSGETYEHTPKPREGITFESVELCALDSALENPENVETLDTLRHEFPDTYTESRTSFFKGSSRMHLDRERFGDFLAAMNGIVLAEKEHLDSKSDLSLLSCGHRVAEHALALKSVGKKIQ